MLLLGVLLILVALWGLLAVVCYGCCNAIRTKLSAMVACWCATAIVLVVCFELKTSLPFLVTRTLPF